MATKKLDILDVSVALPSNVENMQLPAPELVTYYKNLDNRVLWVDDEINTYSIEYAKYIMDWNRQDKGIEEKDRKPITLLFFSPGGDLEVNNLLVDTISMSTTPVIGVNCGMAASAACFIYLACHTRLTFPTAEFLLHKGAGQFSGTYDIVVAAIMNYQRQITELGEFVLSRTNIPEDEFNENFATDWYLSADEAVDYGVAERIIDNLDEII